MSETQENPVPRGKGEGQHGMVNIYYLDLAERRQSSSKQNREKRNSKSWYGLKHHPFSVCIGQYFRKELK